MWTVCLLGDEERQVEVDVTFEGVERERGTWLYSDCHARVYSLDGKLLSAWPTVENIDSSLAIHLVERNAGYWFHRWIKGSY